MLSVEDYGIIRRANRDGMSIRAVARQFHHSRRKVRDALAHPEPQPYTRTKDADAPKLGPFKPTIDQILAADELAPPKQRHTAMQVFRRLQIEHQYAGGYDQVRRYIAGHRQRHEVTFIPLSHDPGQRLELDFGHIYADFPDGRRQVPVLIPTWSFSNFAFALSLPTERIEAILVPPENLIRPEKQGPRRLGHGVSGGLSERSESASAPASGWRWPDSPDSAGSRPLR